MTTNQAASELPERIIKTDLAQYGRRRRQDGPYADNLDLDVLIIGKSPFKASEKAGWE